MLKIFFPYLNKYFIVCIEEEQSLRNLIKNIIIKKIIN